MRSASVVFLLLVGCATGVDSVQTVAFDEWRQIGDSVWRIDATGAAAGPDKRGGFLVSPERYADFTLEVEFWVEDDTNSGVFIRCHEPQTMADLNPDDCYEINIWDDHPVQDFRTGSIVKHVVPTDRVETLGQWSSLVIRADAGTIDVSVNGIPTATLSNAQLTSGFIAVQYAGRNQLRLRNLRITRGSG